jgi:hypothetical protein
MKINEPNFNLKLLKIDYIKKRRNEKINYIEFQKYLIRNKLHKIYNKNLGCFRVSVMKINELSIQEKIEKEFEYKILNKRFKNFQNDLNAIKKNKNNLILPNYSFNKTINNNNLLNKNFEDIKNKFNNKTTKNFLLSRNLSFLFDKKNKVKNNINNVNLYEKNKSKSVKNIFKKNFFIFKNKNLKTNESECEKININKNLYNKYNFFGEKKPFYITKVQKMFTKKIIINKKISTLSHDLIYKKINKSANLEK